MLARLFLSSVLVAAAPVSLLGAQECHECSRRAYSTGTSALALDVGDLDSDGFPDIVVTGFGVAILRGLPDGFVLATTLPLDGDEQVKLGDLDADGDLDLVTTGSQAPPALGSTLRVRLNQGGGILGPVVSYPAGHDASDLVLGDVDGDGDLDAAMTNWNGANASILRNDGTGAFAAQETHALGQTPGSLALGDLDGDGDLDLVAACSSDDTIVVLVNPGNGAFAAGVAYQAPMSPDEIELADLDADGDGDVVVTGRVPYVVSVLHNIGSNTFGAPTSFSLPDQPVKLAMDDLDEDGDEDLVVGTLGTFGGAYVLSNSGSGMFSITDTIHVSGATSIIATDLDADDDTDVVIGSSFDDEILVIENSGGSIPTPPRYPTGVQPTAFVATDLDGDARVDMAVVSTLDDRLTILMGQGDATFVAGASLATQSQPRGIDAADLDQDGDTDLVVANLNSASVSVFDNVGGGNFVAGAVYPSLPGVIGIELADLDQDGDRDMIAVIRQWEQAGMLQIRMNLGGGTFGPASQLSMSWVREAFAADLDGDGDNDLAVIRTSPQGGGVHVLHNTGNGTFVEGGATSVGHNTLALVGGDIDRDGDVDLAVSSSFGQSVVFLPNDGTGSFGALVESSAPLNRALTLGDLDGDGDLDLIAAGTYAIPLLNDGTGAFVPSALMSVGGTIAAVAAHDLDRDGDLEILGVLPDANATFVLRACDVSGAPYCFGDGSGTVCPCGNASPPGARAGCSNSLGAAGKLVGRGSASVAQDELVLTCTQLAPGACLYFQGNASLGGGVVFGDGLLCASGNRIRIGQAAIVGGTAQYPTPGAPSVSTRGLLPPAGGTRRYQALYRDLAPFCAPAAFNLTNAVAIVWMP
jgi:hypothetical protein